MEGDKENAAVGNDCDMEKDLDSRLSEFEQDKINLEKKIEAMKSTRINMEQKMTDVRERHSVMTDMHSKLQDAYSVAKSKAKEMEQKAKGLENKSMELRQGIENLQTLIIEEKETHVSQINMFEQQLEEVSNTFESITEEVGSNYMLDNIKKAEVAENEISEKVALANNTLNDLLKELPPEKSDDNAKQLLLNFVEEENSETVLALKMLDQQKQALQEELEGVTAQPETEETADQEMETDPDEEPSTVKE